MAEISEEFVKDISKFDKSTQDTLRFNAAQQGLTAEEYLQKRGGVNAVGFYGDMYDPNKQLSVAEYNAARDAAITSGAKGGDIGAAINKATGIKTYNYFISQGLTPDQAEKVSGYTATGGWAGGAAGNASDRANQLFGMFQSGAIDKATFDKMLANLSRPGFSESGNDGSGSATGFGPGSKGYDDRKSAYDLLYSQFAQYGLGSLVEPLKGLIMEGVSPSEFTLRLRETDAYKKRFAANQTRINQGLRALSEAEYIGLEDSYQDIMRRYGLPESYYARGDMGIQQGFEKFIGNDVSPVELEDRIQTAQNRVNNAPKQVKDALTQFYGAELGNGDILAYVLDPSKAIENIKRKVTAAEIGAGASMAGLGSTRTRAEELASFGVTGEQARQGFSSIAEFLPSATKLSQIYGKQGLGDYDQAVAEQEVFGTTGAAQAAAKRKKLAQLETAEFSGSSGITGGALSRERAGQF